MKNNLSALLQANKRKILVKEKSIIITHSQKIILLFFKIRLHKQAK